MNSLHKSGVNPCDKCHFSAAERGKFVRHVKGVTRMKFNLVINATYPFDKCYLSAEDKGNLSFEWLLTLFYTGFSAYLLP